MMESDFRFTANYRKQWGWLQNAFRNQSFHAEAGFLPDSRHFNRLGAGLYIMQEEAGSSKLNRFEARGNVAYHVPVSSKDFFSAGMGASFVQRSINYDNLKWDAQYNGAGYDPTLDDKENLTSNSISYFDFALGLYWNHKNRDSEWNFGLASHHFRQNQSLLEESKSPLQMKHNFMFSYTYRQDRLAYTFDGIAVRQSGAMETSGGLRIQYTLGGNSRYTNFRTSSNIFAGAFYRFKDAVIPMIGFEYQRMASLTLSYDITLSPLSKMNGPGGALELTLVYRGNLSSSRRSLGN